MSKKSERKKRGKAGERARLASKNTNKPEAGENLPVNESDKKGRNEATRHSERSGIVKKRAKQKKKDRPKSEAAHTAKEMKKRADRVEAGKEGAKARDIVRLAVKETEAAIISDYLENPLLGVEQGDIAGGAYAASGAADDMRQEETSKECSRNREECEKKLKIEVSHLEN